MSRRTVELGRVRIEGIRLQPKDDGDDHFASLRFGGRVVDVPISPAMASTVWALFGDSVRLALIVDDGDPTKGESWRESNADMYARRKSQKRKPANVAPDKLSDEDLLAHALAGVEGRKASLGPACGMSRSLYGNLEASLRNGSKLSPKSRGRLERFIAKREKE